MDSALRMPGDHCMWCVEPSDVPCRLGCRKPAMAPDPVDDAAVEAANEAYLDQMRRAQTAERLLAEARASLERAENELAIYRNLAVPRSEFDEAVARAEKAEERADWDKQERKRLLARAEKAEREHSDFVENLTEALNDAGVPAMPSWQAAIDYLVARAEKAEREARNRLDAVHQDTAMMDVLYERAESAEAARDEAVARAEKAEADAMSLKLALANAREDREIALREADGAVARAEKAEADLSACREALELIRDGRWNLNGDRLISAREFAREALNAKRPPQT